MRYEVKRIVGEWSVVSVREDGTHKTTATFKGPFAEGAANTHAASMNNLASELAASIAEPPKPTYRARLSGDSSWNVVEEYPDWTEVIATFFGLYAQHRAELYANNLKFWRRLGSPGPDGYLRGDGAVPVGPYPMRPSGQASTVPLAAVRDMAEKCQKNSVPLGDQSREY